MRRASLAASSLPCIRFLKPQTPIRCYLRPSKRPSFNNRHPFNATMAFLTNRHPRPSAVIKHLAPNTCPAFARKKEKAAHRCGLPCKTWNKCRQEGCIAGQFGTQNHTPPNAERPANAARRQTTSARTEPPDAQHAKPHAIRCRKAEAQHRAHGTHRQARSVQRHASLRLMRYLRCRPPRSSIASQNSSAKRGSLAAISAFVAIQPEGVPVSNPDSGSITTAYMASRSRLRAMASVS